MRRQGPACREQKRCRCGRSAGRDRSCETTRSPASEPTSPDIDKDFLNRPLSEMLADALPPEGLRVEPSILGIARRRLPSGRVCRRDRSARRTILIRRWLAPALITQPAAAICINASREGFTPRQPALTGNGGE